MLTFIYWFNNAVNSSWAFHAPSPGTHPEVPMSALEVMRRASLGVFGAVAIASAIAPGGGIRVDVAPLRENAGDPTAAWVARAMPGALAQALAEAGRPGAPVSVRIDYVILGPNSGDGGPASSSPDQMVGAVIVGGVVRPLRAQTWYYPAASDPATIEQSNYYRVFQLSRAFAYWAARRYSGTQKSVTHSITTRRMTSRELLKHRNGWSWPQAITPDVAPTSSDKARWKLTRLRQTQKQLNTVSCENIQLVSFTTL
jgi:hypothetical protein